MAIDEELSLSTICLISFLSLAVVILIIFLCFILRTNKRRDKKQVSFKRWAQNISLAK